MEASPNAVVKASSVGKSPGFSFKEFHSLYVRGKKDDENTCEVQWGIQNRQVWPLVMEVDGSR